MIKESKVKCLKEEPEAKEEYLKRLEIIRSGKFTKVKSFAECYKR